MKIKTVHLKVNGFKIWIASLFMKLKKSESLATTLGFKIHLKNTTERDFVNDICWLRHELQHVIQYDTIKLFRLKYIIDIIKNGYSNNKYELEAEKMAIACYPIKYIVVGSDFIVLSYLLEQYIPKDVIELNKKLKTKFKTYPEIIYR